MAELTQARLKEVLNYDPETGQFTWRVTLSRRAVAGSTTGCRKDGYVVIRIDKKLYRAHRLAWLHAYGEWPTAELDHINGVRDDNRLVNLREATSSQNKANSKLSTKTVSGYKGVSWRKRARKWVAEIWMHGKVHYLGSFDSAENAHRAYCEAAPKYHGKFARFE